VVTLQLLQDVVKENLGNDHWEMKNKEEEGKGNVD